MYVYACVAIQLSYTFIIPLDLTVQNKGPLYNSVFHNEPIETIIIYTFSIVTLNEFQRPLYLTFVNYFNLICFCHEREHLAKQNNNNNQKANKIKSEMAFASIEYR